jgi:hypothetical protein
MNTNNGAQLAMDRLFGVREPQIIVGRNGDAKSRRNLVYSQALVAALAAFPGDGVAAHRAAMRAADAADRRKPMRTESPTFPRTPSEEERKAIDAGLLEAFPEETAGDRGRLSIVQEFPDHIVARGADGKLYKITYTFKDGSGVTFGAPQIAESTDEEAQSVGKSR